MGDPSHIKSVARAAIANPENEVFASAVSIWEIGLKRSKGKLAIPDDFADFLSENGIITLSFSASHAQASVLLPPIHGDPFDRALIAQCQLESLTFATQDRVMKEYNVAVLEV